MTTAKAERAVFAIDAGFVKRWHTSVMFFDENVAAHSWGVATLIALLHPEPSAVLLKAALFHDIPEKKTGDVSRWAKKEFPDITLALNAVEAEVNSDYGLTLYLQPEDQIWLNAADLFHAWMFMYRDVMMGNRTMMVDLLQATSAINTMYEQDLMPSEFLDIMEQFNNLYPEVI